MLKKIIKLCLVCVVGILLVPSQVKAVVSPDLTVGGITVDTSNQDNVTGDTITGKVSYSDGVLTLENATIDNLNNNLFYGINCNHDLTINLIGVNKIGRSLGTGSQNSVVYGISCYNSGTTEKEKITFTGDGSLTIYDNNKGVLCENFSGELGDNGSLTIYDYGAEGVECGISGRTGVFKSGNYNISSKISAGLMFDTLRYEGGNLVLSIDQDDTRDIVICDDLTIVPTNVTAKASTNPDGSNPVDYNVEDLSAYKYLSFTLKTPTNTGDTTSPWLYVSVTCFALAVLLIIFGIKNRKRNK